MSRLHLFEFGDQPWLSGWMREAYMDCLSFIHRVYQPYYHLALPMADWADAGHADRILDLASGSGEQVALFLHTCKKLGISPPRFILSDLYPNTRAYVGLQQELGEAAIGYRETPVSALDIQGADTRYWSIFTAFHHFAPEHARRLLQECALKADGLCILELTERTAFQVLSMFFAFPTHLIVPFFARKFRFRKFLFTTLIPIVPFMVAFDGVVSALRTYTKEEIIAMMPPGGAELFTIECQRSRWRFSPLGATMVSFTRKTPLSEKPA